MAPLIDDLSVVGYDSSTSTSTTEQLSPPKHHHLPPLSPSRTKATSSSQPKNDNKRQRNKQKHRVSFSKYSEMYVVEHKDDMSDEEKEAMHMTENDLRRIRRDVSAAISDMKTRGYQYYHQETARASTGSTVSNDDEEQRYYRGLETQLPHAKEQRKERVRFFVNAVLHEQATHGKLSSQWVMQYLCQMTTPFAQAAHVMGIYDCQSVFADLRMEAMQLQQQHHQYHKAR